MIMTWCRLFKKTVTDIDCDLCDLDAGYPVGFWKETCEFRRLCGYCKLSPEYEGLEERE